MVNVAWRYQAITWTLVDLSPVKSCGIHLRAVSQKMLKISNRKTSQNITQWKLQPHLLGTNDIKRQWGKWCVNTMNFMLYQLQFVKRYWNQIYLTFINSLAPGKFEWNFRYVIFKWILVSNGWGISFEIVLIWMSLDFTDDQSTLVQVMAWCRQAISHYLNQCWPRSPTPYGVTRPQWVKLKGELLTLTLEYKDPCLKVTSKDCPFTV